MPCPVPVLYDGTVRRTRTQTKRSENNANARTYSTVCSQRPAFPSPHSTQRKRVLGTQLKRTPESWAPRRRGGLVSYPVAGAQEQRGGGAYLYSDSNSDTTQGRVRTVVALYTSFEQYLSRYVVQAQYRYRPRPWVSLGLFLSVSVSLFPFLWSAPRAVRPGPESTRVEDVATSQSRFKVHVQGPRGLSWYQHWTDGPH